MQAPLKPRTSHGEMVNYYLKMEPHLFKEAVQGQFERIREEREAARAAAKEKEAQLQAAASDKSDLVLYRWLPLLGCRALHEQLVTRASAAHHVPVTCRLPVEARMHFGTSASV